jgi:hypothetical protein
MRTQAQIAASRANGAKSRGPATTIGRAISAQNSTAHGLAGAKLVVIEGESTDRWQALLEACHHEFQPETEIETELVTEIAAARWRLRRCWSMETSLFDMEIAKQRENPEFGPQDYESQHASAARDLGQNMRPHGPLRDPHAAQLRTRYPKSLPTPRPPQKPKISKRTQEFRRIIRTNDRSRDQLRPESGAAAIRVPRQAPT